MPLHHASELDECKSDIHEGLEPALLSSANYHGRIIASLGDLGYADMRTEIPVERFFGQIKSHFRGTCGVKDKFLVGQECNCVCVCACL